MAIAQNQTHVSQTKASSTVAPVVPLPVVPTRSEKEELIDKLEYFRTKDREKVRGIFRFFEVPGGSMSFNFKGYKKDPVERFDLVDGEIYTIPLGVAKHLNKNLWYPVHGFALDENGKQSMRVTQKVRRCSFQSLEFIDVDDLTPVGKSLIEVEKIEKLG